jgi:hypothetical protein
MDWVSASTPIAFTTLGVAQIYIFLKKSISKLSNQISNLIKSKAMVLRFDPCVINKCPGI